MTMFSLSLLSLALIPFVSAQSGNVALEIEAIKAHFTQSQIVPELLASFDPAAYMTLNYEGVGNLTPGQAISQAQSGPTPSITVQPANSSVALNGTYTLVCADADVAGRKETEVNRHWLVNGVTIEDNKVDNKSATAITAYAGPGPAEGSGPHRYVFLLYSQPADFTAPEGFTEPIGVTPFDLNKYAQDGRLGPIVAGNYIQVEVGTSTVSVAPTSAVETSTLPVPSSGSGSPTGSGSGANPSQTGAGNGAASVTIGAGSVALAFLSTFLMLL
ncbi:nucleus protein [Moniliophthora roreri MCA 2997]|uniref:Nucleus protein n=2 Tax=Moniliophthora roreri TaxID=221103 RepID=V2Y9P3_MONRO|nr:nucleus protein [Moniliophthora roreri MCA 2997]KAI3610598.1 nucleus protein [Moniliophthora roreri]